MSIDRIGKGSVPPPKPVTETENAKGVHGPEGPKTFEVRPQGDATVSAPAPVAPASASPLERLRRGEVDLDGYLDLKVKEATGHLRGLLPSEIDGIREVLRENVVQDPTLAALVQRATGELPSAKE